MIQLFTILLFGFPALTAHADQNCPELSGTYLCGAGSSSPFYVDAVHYHPKAKGDYFDVYLLYYKYHSRSDRTQDTVIPITLMTGERYWTNAKLPENASRGLQVRATCEIGNTEFATDDDRFDSTGKPLLTILKANQDRTFEETITVGKRKIGLKNEIVLITQQREGKLEGEPTIETCEKVSRRDPNYRFGRTASGWRSVVVEIKLLGKNQTFPDAQDKNVVAKIKGTHQAGKVKIDVISDDPALRLTLPGEAPECVFRNFLKKYGFELK